MTSCVSLNPDMTDAAACGDYPVGKAVPGAPANKTGVARTVTISLTAVADYADAP